MSDGDRDFWDRRELWEPVIWNITSLGRQVRKVVNMNYRGTRVDNVVVVKSLNPKLPNSESSGCHAMIGSSKGSAP